LKFPNWLPGACALALLSAVPALAQRPKPTAAATTHPRAAATKSTGTTRAHRASASGRVDGIAAVVNDDVVLQSDVEDQVALFFTRNPQLADDSTVIDTLRHQVLNQLIDEKLIVAEAKREGITPQETEVQHQVDAAVDDARKRLGDDGFKAQLAKENLTEDKLRAKYRDEATREILAQTLLRKKVNTGKVGPVEAAAYFKAHPDKFPKAPPELKLSVIQIPILPDSATDNAAKAKVIAARRRIAAGERFAKVAADVSEDPSSARSGGDLGFFTAGQMDPAIERAAFSMKLNTVSEPIRSPFGWHIIEVLERDSVKTTAGTDSLDAKGQPVPEAHVRNILVRAQPTQADADRAEALARRVQAEAAKGGDFSALVHRYSKYQGPASPDGDLGFVSLGTLQPNIRAGLDSLGVGQVSPVLANQVGYNIFKVADRHPERPYTMDEIKDELPDAVQQIQFKERYDEWVKGLRAKAHIKVNTAD